MFRRLKRLFSRKKKSPPPHYEVFTTKYIDGECWICQRSTGTPIRRLSSFFTVEYNQENNR